MSTVPRASLPGKSTPRASGRKVEFGRWNGRKLVSVGGQTGWEGSVIGMLTLEVSVD